jgi:hypothetical protein
MPTYIQSFRGTAESEITEPAAVEYEASYRGTAESTITEPATLPAFAASSRGIVMSTITEPKLHSLWTVRGGVKTPLLLKTKATAKDFGWTPGTRDPKNQVGAGKIRPMPTTVITTLTGNVDSDGVVRDKIIDANLTPVPSIEYFENCFFRGAATWTAGGWLLCGNQATASDPIKAYWCTFEPRTPSAYCSGIGPQNVEAYYCEIRHCTDPISSFSFGTGGTHMKFINSWAHTMVRWAPDYATNNRPEGTHNDGIQLQGSNATDPEDVLIDGSRIDGNLHPTFGQPPGPGVTPNLSAVMFNYGVGGKRSLATIRRSWLFGGLATVNGGDDNIANGYGELVMENVIMELRNGSQPLYSLLLDNRLVRSITNVRYTDGSPVVINQG